jgi:MraZ protein
MAEMATPRIKRALYGEYRRPVDEKSRVSIPAEFRPILHGQRGSFFLNRGFERCVMGYPEEKWDRVLDLVSAAPLDDQNMRQFKRAFYSGAREVSCDQQGRVVIPQSLMEYGAVGREVIIVGLSDFIEIWDAEAWGKWLEQSMESYEKTAEKLIQSASQTKEGSQETRRDA